jgi:hypothetical protein
MGPRLFPARVTAGCLLFLLMAGMSSGLPVFPGAAGFGTDTPAGRGGQVCRVTTLADSGPGSLRDAIETLTGPRTIVFDVSGVIRLRSDLKIPAGGGFLTIAGQTAPPPGITLANAGIAIQGNNVLIQNLAIRPGDRLLPVENRDGIKLEPAPDQPVHHVVIDRVSASWAVDETFSTWGSRAPVHDVTLSRSILSEPIINGGHPKGSHPYAALGGRRTTNLTLRENIFAFALGRNPLIRDETGGAQVVNNFIYRPGVWSNGVIYIGDLTLPPHAVSVVGNVVIRHPLPLVLEQTNGKGERAPVSYALSDYRNTAIFVHKATVAGAGLFLADNRFFDPHTGLWHPQDGNPWNPTVFHDNEAHPVKHLAADPYAGSGGTPWQPLSSERVESRVLGGAGKTPAARDALDAALTTKIRLRTGSFRTDLAVPGEVDPWLTVDTPTTRRLALPADPSQDADGDGYTNLEEWLQQLDNGVDDNGRAWLATELAHETFADDSWRKRWIMEGRAETSAMPAGLLVVTTPAPDGTNPGATLWWHEELPADVLIEFLAGAELPAENNAANLNLILHAREADGSPYRADRSGKYDEYHQIPNYILTLTGGFQEGWARVRRNPGFGLLSENQEIRSEPGKNYHVRVAITGGRLRYWLNGRLIHDLRDPNPLPGGRFALRTWRSRVWWSDLRIYSLQPAAEER